MAAAYPSDIAVRRLPRDLCKARLRLCRAHFAVTKLQLVMLASGFRAVSVTLGVTRTV
jgi:hypothetical protein